MIVNYMKGNSKIIIRNGCALPISHIGSVNILSKLGTIKIANVFLAPQFQRNDTSIAQLIDQCKCTFLFTYDLFLAKDQSWRILAKGKHHGNLYFSESDEIHTLFVAAISSCNQLRTPAKLRHHRLAHISYANVEFLRKINALHLYDKVSSNVNYKG